MAQRHRGYRLCSVEQSSPSGRGDKVTGKSCQTHKSGGGGRECHGAQRLLLETIRFRDSPQMSKPGITLPPLTSGTGRPSGSGYSLSASIPSNVWIVRRRSLTLTGSLVG